MELLTWVMIALVVFGIVAIIVARYYRKKLFGF
jgi:hypothetical protein